METFRRARNANANVERPLPPSISTASKLLERRIRHDWELVIGTPHSAPIYTTDDTRRWHPDTYCPTSKADFNAHWALGTIGALDDHQHTHTCTHAI
jgi:hypothetical protein